MQFIEMERIIDNSGEVLLPLKLCDGKPALQPSYPFSKYRELNHILPPAYPDVVFVELQYFHNQCMGLAFN